MHRKLTVLNITYKYEGISVVLVRHSGTVQFWRQTVKSVLLWWFLHQFMLHKSRCHTYGTPRVQNRGLWVGY